MALNGEDRKDTATDMVSQLQGVVSEERVHDVQQEVLVRLVRELQCLRSQIIVSQAKNGLAMALDEEDPKDAATGMVSKLQGIVSEEQAHDAQQDVLVGIFCGLQHLRSLIVYLPGKEWL